MTWHTTTEREEAVLMGQSAEARAALWEERARMQREYVVVMRFCFFVILILSTVFVGASLIAGYRIIK